MNKTIAVAIAMPIVMTGCVGQMTKTTQAESSYIVYDVPKADVNRQQLLDAISSAVKKNTSEVHINRDIPSATLSEKPLRFTFSYPLKGSGMGAILQTTSGQEFKMATCDDSILTMRSNTKNTSENASNTNFFLCVQPYKQGHTISIYSTFIKESGGISAKALASAIVRSTLGDSSQFIPRTMNDVKSAAENIAGVEVKIIDSYIPESFQGAFYNKSAAQ